MNGGTLPRRALSINEDVFLPAAGQGTQGGRAPGRDADLVRPLPKILLPAAHRAGPEADRPMRGTVVQAEVAWDKRRPRLPIRRAGTRRLPRPR